MSLGCATPGSGHSIGKAGTQSKAAAAQSSIGFRGSLAPEGKSCRNSAAGFRGKQRRVPALAKEKSTHWADVVGAEWRNLAEYSLLHWGFIRWSPAGLLQGRPVLLRIWSARDVARRRDFLLIPVLRLAPVHGTGERWGGGGGGFLTEHLERNVGGFFSRFCLASGAKDVYGAWGLSSLIPGAASEEASWFGSWGGGAGFPLPMGPSPLLSDSGSRGSLCFSL